MWAMRIFCRCNKQKIPIARTSCITHIMHHRIRHHAHRESGQWTPSRRCTSHRHCSLPETSHSRPKTRSKCRPQLMGNCPTMHSPCEACLQFAQQKSAVRVEHCTKHCDCFNEAVRGKERMIREVPRMVTGGYGSCIDCGYLQYHGPDEFFKPGKNICDWCINKMLYEGNLEFVYTYDE